MCVFFFGAMTVDDGTRGDRGTDNFEAVPGHDVVVVAGVPELPLRAVLVQPSVVPLGQGGAGLQDMDALDDVHGRERLHQLGGVCVCVCFGGVA